MKPHIRALVSSTRPLRHEMTQFNLQKAIHRYRYHRRTLGNCQRQLLRAHGIRCACVAKCFEELVNEQLAACNKARHALAVQIKVAEALLGILRR